jgi:hypothetical protein
MEEQLADWIQRQVKEGFGILVAPWEHGVIMSQVLPKASGTVEVLVSVGEVNVEKAYTKLRQEIETPYTHAKKPLSAEPVDPNAPNVAGS